VSAGDAEPGARAVDGGDMPVAFEARDEFEAECARSVLEDSGIRSVVLPAGQAIFGFPLRAGGRTVPVRVLPDDLSRARQVLAEARWTGRSVDWDQVDVGEVPPEVARVLARSRTEAWIRRAHVALAWLVLALVAAGFVVSVVRLVRG